MPRSILSLFLVAALPLGCTGAAFAQSETLVDRQFPVRDGQSLVVNVGAGAVTVETTARREATVVVRGTGANAVEDFEALRFTAVMDGSTLRVRTNPRRGLFGRSRSSSSQFSYTVRVPRRFT